MLEAGERMAKSDDLWYLLEAWAIERGVITGVIFAALGTTLIIVSGEQRKWKRYEGSLPVLLAEMTYG